MLKLVHIFHGVVVSEKSVEEGDMTIGRNSGNTLQLDDPVVSGQHAVLKAEKNPYLPEMLDVTIEDLNSTNGTFVNNTVVTQQSLHHGDIVRVGTHEFKLVDDQHSEGTQTEYYVPED